MSGEGIIETLMSRLANIEERLGKVEEKLKKMQEKEKEREREERRPKPPEFLGHKVRRAM